MKEKLLETAAQETDRFTINAATIRLAQHHLSI